MTLTAVALFLLGFLASWVAGRYLDRGASVLQGGAIAICGVAAMFLGMTAPFTDSLLSVFGVLLIYGMVGALIFRAAQNRRPR